MKLLLKIITIVFLLPVYIYRVAISPFLPDMCRHTPTCSQYCIEAVKVHGIVIGLTLATFRILRCNPFGTHGYDPVPEKGTAWEYIKHFFEKKGNEKNEE